MKRTSSASQIIAKISAFPWLAEGLAGLALILYFVQSVGFAHAQWSVLDEGNYIYKGWLFATGQYIQYQAYGPLTNHMPFSYLIFGWMQLLFGPGLRTVRYFMIFTGCLFMLGMWLTSRRLAGRWAAALCLWFIALNPFPISDYSIAISEGLVACLLTWILYFTLGENRSSKELLAGSLLTAVMVLLRENMVLVLPIIFLYMLWQHGKKAALMLFAITSISLIGAHIIFWPGIMEVWDRWIPNNMRAYVGDLTFQDAATPLNAPPLQKIFILFGSVRTNFMAFFSVLAVWLSWPKNGFKNPAQLKIIVFLSAIFIELYLAHATASLGKNYCAFCLVNYVTFFSPAGILMFFAFLPGIRERQPIFPVWLAGGVILILMAGLGYSNYENFGQSLAALQFPRISNLTLQPGSIELWKLLTNKFNIDYQTLRRLLPVIAGFLLGLFILIVGYILSKISKNHRPLAQPVYALFFITMLIGLTLSPTVALGKVVGTCEKSVIDSYEQVGRELRERVSPGAQIYWRGDPSPTALLYLPNVKIYPAQLNAFFSKKPGSDSDKALRFGFWNDELDLKWHNEADFVLVRVSDYASMQALIPPDQFTELPPTAPTYGCAGDSNIRIFQRK